MGKYNITINGKTIVLEGEPIGAGRCRHTGRQRQSNECYNCRYNRTVSNGYGALTAGTICVYKWAHKDDK